MRPLDMRALLRILCVAVLLLFYLAGNTPFTFIHQLVHPDELQHAHSATDEIDPCHRTIYHGGEKGCNHEFHIEKVSGCSLFHTVVYTDQICFESCQSNFIRPVLSFHVDVTTDASGDVGFSFLSRGPPLRNGI
ncbi:MAG: hypothetical protein WKF87_17390 [Chryseolinea sp.]